MFLRLTGLPALIFLVAGCGSGPPLCVPGASVACACPEGQTGAQLCNAQGTFNSCSCSTREAGAPTDAALPMFTDGGPGNLPVPDAGPMQAGPVRDLDILFLIDNSPTMQEEQEKLGRNFAVFMNELKRIPGGLPNVHIGVVSSDLGAGQNFRLGGACARPGGDRGVFQTKPTCGLSAGSLFISSSANQTVNNFTGDLTNVFACIAGLGARGCGFEQTLQATRIALYESITRENAGFLRRDAFLAIVLLSDEDDCSADQNSDLFNDEVVYSPSTNTAVSLRCAHTGHLCEGKAPPLDVFDAPLESCRANDGGRLLRVAEIVDSIRALKPRPDQQIVVSAIVGWPQNAVGARYRYVRSGGGALLDYAPICQSANGGDATAALRIKQFVEGFGAAGHLFSICDEDFSPAMKQIGEALAGRF